MPVGTIQGGVVSVEAVLPALRVSVIDALSVDVARGAYDVAGTINTFPGATSVVIVDDATNYLYVDAAGQLVVNQSGYPVSTAISHVRIARVIAAGGVVQSVFDDRVALTSVGAGGGGGGGGYATILDEGTAVTTRTVLNVVGPLLAAADDAENARTTLTSAAFGSSPGTVAEGADVRFPTTGEKNALAGTSGTPGTGNRYVTDTDIRNANARTPTAHTSSHRHGGGDEVASSTAGANLIPKATAEGVLAAEWVSESAVTQHQAALSITDAQVTGVRCEKHLTIESPSAAEDLTWFFTDRAITVTKVSAVLTPQAGSPSVTWAIRHSGDRAATGTPLVTAGRTTTSITSADTITAFDNPNIAANSFVWLETTAASQAAQLALTLSYTEN